MSSYSTALIDLPLFELGTAHLAIQDLPLFGIFLFMSLILCCYLAANIWKQVANLATIKVMNQNTSEAIGDRENPAHLSFYLTIAIIGLISARCGYFLMYFPDYLSIQPWVLFDVNAGGFSLYAGIIGGLLFLFYKQRTQRIIALSVADSITLVLPIGIGIMALFSIFFEQGEFGRNVGTSTELIWAASYKFDGGTELRHPIAIYNFIFAGVLLFAVLQFLKKYTKQLGVITGCFLVLFGLFSFIIQFITQQSPEYEPIFWFLSIKQVIDLCAIFVGLYLLHWGYINNAKVLISGKKVCEPI